MRVLSPSAGYSLLTGWVLSRSSPAERRLSALQPRRLACSRLAHRCAQLRATHSNLKPAERRRSAADSAVGHTLMRESSSLMWGERRRRNAPYLKGESLCATSQPVCRTYVPLFARGASLWLD